MINPCPARRYNSCDSDIDLAPGRASFQDMNTRCFETSSGPGLREARLADVVDLLPLTHNEAAIEQYRCRMLSGELFPPISVLPLFGRLVIADGHKRYQAARTVTQEPVPVELWTFRRLLADQWRQVRANARKNRRIVSTLFVRPSESLRLMRSTLLHWLRVARCLRLLFTAPRVPRR